MDDDTDISYNDRLEVKDEVTSVLNESVNNIEIVNVKLEGLESDGANCEPSGLDVIGTSEVCSTTENKNIKKKRKRSVKTTYGTTWKDDL